VGCAPRSPLLAPCDPEKQWPARSRRAETSARRLRSRRKVTGDWRKAPRGWEEPRGLSELGAGGVEARRRAGRAPRPSSERCPRASPRRGTVTRPVCGGAEEGTRGRVRSELPRLKARVKGSGRPRPCSAGPLGNARAGGGQGTPPAESVSTFGNHQPQGDPPPPRASPGARVGTVSPAALETQSRFPHFPRSLGSGVDSTLAVADLGLEIHGRTVLGGPVGRGVHLGVRGPEVTLPY
jgi:hypothetical protein